jgi:hypothetical protein
VKKAIFAVLLIACFVSVAMAAQHSDYRAARPGLVGAGRVQVHPFVNAAEIEAATTKVFISDFDNDTVGIYSTSGKQLASISGLSNPQGLAIDAKNNLYVANTGGSEVLIYASPYTKSPKSLSDSGQYPVGISVFNNGEVIAVSNIFSTSGGAGSVTVFKNGKASAPISNSSFEEDYFCAFDASGNLYVDGRQSSGATILGIILAAEKGGKTLKTITTKNTIEFPGGIAVTTAGDVAIDDQDAATVYTYKPVAKGSLGSPISTTAMTGVGDAVNIAFGPAGDVWEADAENLSAGEYAYPKGGKAVKSWSIPGAAEPIGIAISPAVIP